MNSFISERKILLRRHDAGSRNLKLLPKVTLPSRAVTRASQTNVNSSDLIRSDAFRECLLHLPKRTDVRPSYPLPARRERELVSLYSLFLPRFTAEPCIRMSGIPSTLMYEMARPFASASLHESEEGDSS